MPAATDRAPLGVIHGRFQVLHNDHLRYLLAGREQCEHLVVGVTNPDPTLCRDEAVDPHRGRASANPLSFFERQAMVRAVLTEAGVPPADLTVVPFPINRPELYAHYVPLDAVFFLTIYDDWGRAKRDYLLGAGLDVRVLWDVPPEDKGLSGSSVRRLMAEDGPWESLVPPATARLCKAWNVPARLRAMAETD